MTNIITAVVLNVLSHLRTMFFVSKRFWTPVFSKSRRLCKPVTFANDDIMASQCKKLWAKWPLRSSWFILLVIRWNIRKENPKRSVIVQNVSKRAAAARGGFPLHVPRLCTRLVCFVVIEVEVRVQSKSLAVWAVSSDSIICKMFRFLVLLAVIVVAAGKEAAPPAAKKNFFSKVCCSCTRTHCIVVPVNQ